MRLFLSSESFGIFPEVLIELVGLNKKVAFIDNAKDDIPASERAQHVNEKKLEFERLGFIFEELDLRKYFGKQEELKHVISSVGLVWGSGGNTFLLRRAMKNSGLDTVITELLHQDKLAYGGSSAGSIVATPSLNGTELGDDPKVVPEGYNKEIIWEGLNLVPFYIVPHYKSDWFGGEAEKMVGYLESQKLPFHALMDGQVVLIDAEKEEVLK